MTERLLAHLQTRVNPRGLVLATADGLRRKLRTSQGDLTQALCELERGGSIEILTPGPFLVIRLTKWSGKEQEPAKKAAKPAASKARAYSFQSSLSQSKPLNESYRPPVNEEALLREILTTLGESDPTTFRGAIRSYRPEVISLALARIRRMKKVRTNRTAVFRFLLPRLAKETPSAK